jgi:hypothetical protein
MRVVATGPNPDLAIIDLICSMVLIEGCRAHEIAVLTEYGSGVYT